MAQNGKRWGKAAVAVIFVAILDSMDLGSNGYRWFAPSEFCRAGRRALACVVAVRPAF